MLRFKKNKLYIIVKFNCYSIHNIYFQGKYDISNY